MDEYTPSPDFVGRVMEKVREYEDKRQQQPAFATGLLKLRLVRLLLPLTAGILAGANILRVYLTLFAPGICH